MPRPLSNMYGVHPTYTCLENDGNSHAVLMLNSGAQEWSIGGPGPPTLVYRTIAGIVDFYVFTGPEPEDVNRQYTEAVGKNQMHLIKIQSKVEFRSYWLIFL